LTDRKGLTNFKKAAMQSPLAAGAYLAAVLNVFFYLLLHLSSTGATAMAAPALVSDTTPVASIALGRWTNRAGTAVVAAWNSAHMCLGSLNILTPGSGGSPCTGKPFQVGVELKPDGRPTRWATGFVLEGCDAAASSPRQLRRNGAIVATCAPNEYVPTGRGCDGIRVTHLCPMAA
jgi:hypothetical protein